MDDAKRELVRAWIIKARRDLDTARQISGLPDAHLDAAIYHCQQATENAAKGVGHTLLRLSQDRSSRHRRGAVSGSVSAR